jgi:hypothetical protein
LLAVKALRDGDPDGGMVETASKTIPILLQTLDLGIYRRRRHRCRPVRIAYVEGRTPAQNRPIWLALL